MCRVLLVVLSVGHSGTCIIVFVKCASGLLSNIEVPEDAADVRKNFGARYLIVVPRSLQER
jgi:hypothetical protein